MSKGGGDTGLRGRGGGVKYKGGDVTPLRTVELSTSGGKPSDADILAEIRGEIVDDEEADDALEVEGKPPVCPTSLEVDKALEVLQQLTLFSEKGNEMREVVEKVNACAQREIMKRRKQKTINHYFNKL